MFEFRFLFFLHTVACSCVFALFLLPLVWLAELSAFLSVMLHHQDIYVFVRRESSVPSKDQRFGFDCLN